MKVVLLAIAFMLFSANAGEVIKSGNIGFYMYEASSSDSAGIALSSGEVLGDSITASGSLWYELGPTPIDSATLSIVEDGVDTVSCSLFVSMSRGKYTFDSDWMKFISGNASIITDSMNAGTGNTHFYKLPDLTRYKGYNLLLKIFGFANTTTGAIKKVAISSKN